MRIGHRIVLAVLLLSMTAAAQEQKIKQIAQAVDKRYNNLLTLEADFTEIYRGSGPPRTESGALMLKRPGKMRWSYREPREKLFVSDGKNAWFYVPGEQQARRADVKKLDDLRSPIRYLLGKTRLEREFEGLSLAVDQKAASPGNVVLRGVPRVLADRVSQVLLEISPDNWIQGIVVQEADGSATEFRFSNQRENLPIADERFKFIPPRGVETIEASDLGQ